MRIALNKAEKHQNGRAKGEVRNIAHGWEADSCERADEVKGENLAQKKRTMQKKNRRDRCTVDAEKTEQRYKNPWTCRGTKDKVERRVARARQRASHTESDQSKDRRLRSGRNGRSPQQELPPSTRPRAQVEPQPPQPQVTTTRHGGGGIQQGREGRSRGKSSKWAKQSKPRGAM